MSWLTRQIGPSFKPSPGASLSRPEQLLRWVHVFRLSVASVVFFAAAFYFKETPPGIIVVLAVAALLSVVVSGLSFWYTDILGRHPGATFRYTQAVFDLALVTAVVHVTGGADSSFSSLYILVIAVSAVLMPLASSLLITGLAAMLYIADIVWGHPFQMSLAIFFQVAVFVGVALATGWLAGRVQVVGEEREVLQQEMQRLRLEAGDILRNIASGIVTVDNDGNLAYANRAAEKLLEFSVEAFIDRPIADFLNNRSPELWTTVVQTQHRGYGYQGVECDVSVDGRTFAIGVTTTAVELEAGLAPSVTAIFTDISARKRLDALKLRNERLEAVAELSASLAHEIKNPLASIRSSVEQLAGSVRSGDDERVLAELMVRETDRLSRLLNEFLDFSGVQVTNSRRLELGALVARTIGLVREHPDCSPNSSIELTEEQVEIEGDEDLLHRVVFNLVLNAVQAAGESARIQVAVRRASAEELPRGVAMDDPVVIQISDNGPGIAEEIRERIFEPFVTGRNEGSGLGLAIVQRAVHAHKGMVLVDSESESGTTFTVIIPTASAGGVAT